MYNTQMEEHTIIDDYFYAMIFIYIFLFLNIKLIRPYTASEASIKKAFYEIT